MSSISSFWPGGAILKSVKIVVYCKNCVFFPMFLGVTWSAFLLPTLRLKIAVLSYVCDITSSVLS